ncbi:AidA/PixA family protein [Trinickia dinghuensis]|uniref:Inclusion body protein n=1 Tax=Trinickia dinghuensis TaxID=2291023 RepID=A0A3D8K1A6_9BURK|nr:AidA/PixA family protein [Trinickia dinghuensis]RDU98674.1 hypothetical protein DWV00_10360 [Trinickia dinghuensis]
MSIINVTMFVDIIGILRNYPVSGSTDTCIEGFEKYIFFVTDWSDVNFGGPYGVRSAGKSADEGSCWIDIKAAAGDCIHFRAIGLSLGFEYQCFIHPFSFSDSRIVSDAKPVASSRLVAVRDQAGKVVVKQIDDYHLEAQVTGPGHVSYRVSFSVFDSTGVRIAILTLDPNIEIPGTSRYAVG